MSNPLDPFLEEMSKLPRKGPNQYTLWKCEHCEKVLKASYGFKGKVEKAHRVVCPARKKKA